MPALDRVDALSPELCHLGIGQGPVKSAEPQPVGQRARTLVHSRAQIDIEEIHRFAQVAGSATKRRFDRSRRDGVCDDEGEVDITRGEAAHRSCDRRPPRCGGQLPEVELEPACPRVREVICLKRLWVDFTDKAEHSVAGDDLRGPRRVEAGLAGRAKLGTLQSERIRDHTPSLHSGTGVVVDVRKKQSDQLPLVGQLWGRPVLFARQGKHVADLEQPEPRMAVADVVTRRPEQARQQAPSEH